MDLIDIIDKKLIEVNFTAKSKDEALRKIAHIASKSKFTDGISEEVIYEKINERESMGSTGFGDGIAMPHARIAGITDFVVFILVSKKGIEFDALDSKKANIFCVILAPEEKVNEHLKVLAAFSRYLSTSGFKRELLAASDSNIVWESIVRHSDEAESGGTSRKMKLVVLILYFDEYLYHILEFLIEHGVKGANIIESSGMGAYISSIPLFASFLGFMREDMNKSKTIMFLIPEDREGKIVEGIERITGDLDKKEGAMIMTMDIGLYKGTMEIM